MGMSSSQARLLTLTSRLHSIEHKAQKIEAEKLRLANDSDRVYENYLEKLDATKIQYNTLTADGNIEYKDASYLDLMVGRPGSQYLMYSTTSNKVCLAEELVNIYNSSANADDFVQKLKEYRSQGSAGDPNFFGGRNTTGGTTPTPTPDPTPTPTPTPDPTPTPTPTPTPDPDPTPTPTPDPDPDPTPTPDPDPDPDPTPDPDPDPDVPDTADYTLSRGQQRTITPTADGVTVCLTNAFDKNGNQYYYTIKSNTGEAIKLEFLKNGRLQITGNNFELEAKNNQEDDLIINGHNNIINTGNKNDLIRLGMTIDESGCITGENNSYNSAYLTDVKNSCQNNTYNNTINAGAGDDYIMDFTGGRVSSSNYQGNTINGGSGDDVYRNESVKFVSRDTNSDRVTDSGYFTDSNTITGIKTNVNSESMKTASIDNQIGSYGQGGLGDCRFLSLLASLKAQGKSFSDLGITINKSGTSYNVRFNNYPGGAKTVNISESELYPSYSQSGVTNLGISNKYAQGDIDTRIVELAANKSMQNTFGKTLENASYQEYSRYLFGNSNVSLYLNENAFPSLAGYSGNVSVSGATVKHDSTTKMDRNLIKNLWNKYKSGKISNLEVSTGDHGYSDTLQICNNHSYSVADVQNDYITLINPWDSEDKLKLSWDDFEQYFDMTFVYGDTSSDYLTNVVTGELQNNDGSTLSETDTQSDNNSVENPVITLSYKGTTSTMADSYKELYDIIGQAIASNNYELIPGDMVNSGKFLTNAINSGAVYLKQFNKSENQWIDTSVATTTELREVSNEENLKKAEAEYEADMRKIDAKDKRYDTQLAACETERNAIKEEVDTLKTVAKENVERTFKLFS